VQDDNVYELEDFRARRTVIPAEALAEIELAGRLCEALAAQGFSMRFDEPDEPGARVRVLLVSDDGADGREVSLAEAVGADDNGLPPLVA